MDTVNGYHESSSESGGIKKYSTAYLLFIVQVLVILIVVITSIANLTVQNGNMNLWTALLSSCLGYVLPNPKLKEYKKT